MVADLRERLMASYPAAVVRRFFDLELLDRSFAIAAQAFVALLPLIIVVVSAVLRSDGVIVAEQINDRFGLEGAASVAVEALFRSESTVIAVSWLALAMALLSAFSLSRRLSRTYGLIFGVPGLGSRQLWRGLVWIGVQMALMTLGSGLRTVGREGGALLTVVAVVGLLVLWLAADTAALRLLVPSLPWSVLLPTAVLSMVGRDLHAPGAHGAGHPVRPHRRDLRDLHVPARRRSRAARSPAAGVRLAGATVRRARVRPPGAPTRRVTRCR